MANLIALFRLQQAESQLEEYEKELSLMDGSVKEERELQEAEALFEKFLAQKREAERLLKDAELELAGLEAEKKNVEEKLYGGKVAGAKELSQLEKDLQLLNKKREKLDEQVLRRMEQLESLEKNFTGKKDFLEEVKGRFEKARASLLERKGSLEKLLQEGSEKRDVLIQSLDSDLLEKYRDIKERKGGVAVVRVNAGNCTGCFMNVPESSVQKVKAFELVQCSSCGRILV